MNDTIAPPYACRYLSRMIMAMSEVIRDDTYLNMSRGQFIGTMMQRLGGSATTVDLSEWYDRLMLDAYG